MNKGELSRSQAILFKMFGIIKEESTNGYKNKKLVWGLTNNRLYIFVYDNQKKRLILIYVWENAKMK
jgi:hypothetical protein